MSKKSKHNQCLEKVIKNLHIIGEYDNLRFMLKEPVWYRGRTKDKEKMCDLILGYDWGVVPVEIKGSVLYEGKAVRQLKMANRFVNECFGLSCVYGKIVYYSGEFKFNRFNF
jgi:hypothetical protein